MATLTPIAFVGGTGSAFVWKCSECDAAFALERITARPSVTQFQIVNANFGVHCLHHHPQSSVVGLMIPAMDDDVAKTAFCVLPESTEGK